MATHDWSRFMLRIPINAKSKDIYQAWTTQQGLESWFLRSAIFNTKEGSKRSSYSTIEKGDTYKWLWYGYPDNAVESGTILDINDHSFSFIFGKAGIVTVSFKNELDENIVELVQSDIPTDPESQINYYIGCSKGWNFYLTNLKSILEGGIDLRNRKVELKNVITA